MRLTAEFKVDYSFGEKLYKLDVDIDYGNMGYNQSIVYPLDIFESHFDRIWKDIGRKIKDNIQQEKLNHDK